MAPERTVLPRSIASNRHFAFFSIPNQSRTNSRPTVAYATASLWGQGRTSQTMSIVHACNSKRPPTQRPTTKMHFGNFGSIFDEFFKQFRLFPFRPHIFEGGHCVGKTKKECIIRGLSRTTLCEIDRIKGILISRMRVAHAVQLFTNATAPSVFVALGRGNDKMTAVHGWVYVFDLGFLQWRCYVPAIFTLFT